MRLSALRRWLATHWQRQAREAAALSPQATRLSSLMEAEESFHVGQLPASTVAAAQYRPEANAAFQQPGRPRLKLSGWPWRLRAGWPPSCARDSNGRPVAGRRVPALRRASAASAAARLTECCTMQADGMLRGGATHSAALYKARLVDDALKPMAT